MSIATNFNNYLDITGNQTERAKSYLSEALVRPFAEAKKNHVEFYRRYLTRVSLDLGEDQYKNVTTDKRVENFKDTHDAHLVATYFQFGRYLLICSSQPGGQPANLQGIWNDKLFPSWDSKYTCNINLEMNYWPSEVTNLSDLNEPLFRLIKEVSESGKETAKIMYGANGWVLHHNTDIWRITGALDKAPSGMWPSGGAWLCRHLWERYLYTGDTEFLRSVYPILKESGLFFDEIMVKEPVHNWLVVCPSNSSRKCTFRQRRQGNYSRRMHDGQSVDIRPLDSYYFSFPNFGYGQRICRSSGTTPQRNGSYASRTLGTIAGMDVRLG